MLEVHAAYSGTASYQLTAGVYYGTFSVRACSPRFYHFNLPLAVNDQGQRLRMHSDFDQHFQLFMDHLRNHWSLVVVLNGVPSSLSGSGRASRKGKPFWLSSKKIGALFAHSFGFEAT